MVDTVADVSTALEVASLKENGNHAVEVEQEADVCNRHRKERKEMQAQIQELKKNAPKSDKKKRKDVMEQVARLEIDMEKRHAAELKATASRQQQKLPELENAKSAANGTSQPSKDNEEQQLQDLSTSLECYLQVDSPQTRVSKAQKRRDKKEQEARELQKKIVAAGEEAQTAPKATEARQLAAKLKERSLALHEIRSDGDCLYNAVRHQLQLTGRGDYSLAKLRLKTANYIRANKETLIWYMTDPKTNETLNDVAFEAYCDAVRSTPAWGGQVELKALSSVLQVPIEVIQADGGSVVQGGSEFPGPCLLIVYHRHMYSLGEHYNSTEPAKENDGVEDPF